MVRQLALGVVSILLCACIERSQPYVSFDGFVPADTATTDTAAADVEVVSTSCTVARDCVGPLDECQRWECVDELCVPRGLDGGVCDRYDICTIGTCASGRCLSIPRLCGSQNGCLRPSCRSDVGCETVPTPGGFCEVSGPGWGECSGPLMYPADRCDDAGSCTAAWPGGNPAPDFAGLSGEWLVLRHGLTGAAPTSELGSLNFALSGPEALASFFPSRANGAIVDVLLPTSGTWCMAPDRGFHVNLPGLGAWDGQVAIAGEVFGAYGFERNEVVLGIRATGLPAEMTGTYRVFAIHSDRARPVGAWVGTATFDAGCLTTVARLQGAPGMANLELRAGQCIEAGGVGETGHLLSAQWNAIPSGQMPFAMNFEGGASGGGDVFLGSWADSGEGEEVGLFVAVREGRTESSENSSWFTAYHELRHGPDATIAGATGQRALSRVGSNQILNGLGISGRFGAVATPIGPESFNLLDGPFRVVSRDGRVDLSPRTTAGSHIWSGALAAHNRLGFFMEVEPWTAGGDELVRPAWPSFGVIVERPMSP